VLANYGEEKRGMQSFGGGKMKERDHLEELGVDGRINIKMDIKIDLLEWCVLNCSGLGHGRMEGSCKHDNPGYIQRGEFPD
jgi:hypothetical protein